MKFYKCLSISLGLLFLFSCKEEPVRWQLREQVLSYYRDSVPNEDKYRAALFLLENMDAHYSVSNPAIDSFYTFMDSVYSLPVQGNGFYHSMYDEANRRFGYDMTVDQILMSDTGTVTARYLIENIDSAYSVWNARWAGNYSFEHFCNYVLPYRMGHEPLSDWRKKYKEQQLPRVEKLVYNQENRFLIYGTYSAINQGMHTAIYYPKGFTPEFPVTKLDRMRVGTCQTFSDLSIARFRSVGVPVAKDFVPQWGNRSMGHDWVVLLPDEEQCFPFGPNEQLGTHFNGRTDNIIPKVFRRMYAKQQELLPLTTSGEPLPSLSASPLLYRTIHAEWEWYDVATRSLSGQTRHVMPRYEALHGRLRHSPHFLYNYAAELNYIGEYTHSQQVLDECMQRMDDYDTRLLAASNHEHMGNYGLTEIHLMKASAMCPVRFVPLYQLAKLYGKMNRYENQRCMAQQIIDKKEKVPSQRVTDIKDEMRYILEATDSK